MAKKNIAILGGGIGALSAAFELTSYDGWQADHDVTVYQMGWRLGGKCATGRNASIRNRIEEHGIHFLLGFYENAFHLIRRLYAEDPAPPFPTWKDAFRNQSTTTAMVFESGEWSPFGIQWPANGDLPGEESRFQPGSKPPKPWDYVAKVLGWMKSQTHSLQEEFAFRDANTTLTTLQTLVANSYEIANKYSVPPPAESDDLATIEVSMQQFGESVAATMRTESWRADVKQFLILLDVGAAIVRGVIADGVIFNGFEVIDNRELMRWLVSHGCHFPNSTVIRSGYDACFAYAGGDSKRPMMSAAVGLHGALRLWFTYRGSIFWPMQAGMAEVIFAPLYRVLRRRGVNFQFFHRVARLGLSSDRRAIDTIDIDVQAQLKKPAEGYQPFVSVKGLNCWPNQPLYDQLVNGDQLTGDMESAWNAPAPVGTRRLLRGQDFTDVICGISIGAIPGICGELLAASAQWRAMVANVSTVQTQALQLWLKARADQLGYSAGTIAPNTEAPCVSSFVEPFDTYVDMSALKVQEEWQSSDQVQHLAYFCNALVDDARIPAPGTDPGFPARQADIVKQNSLTFLKQQVAPLWPGSASGVPDFNWNLLVDPRGGTGEQRLDSQYWRANIDPSSRYVLSPPGAIQHRLQPGGSGFDNLYLAGDWTYTPMNSGCVEAATMSGYRASQAICGHPDKIYGWD